MTPTEQTFEDYSGLPPEPDPRPRRLLPNIARGIARLLAAGALVPVVGLWLYPLSYIFVEGECGADISLGLYAFFIATPATVFALVWTAMNYRDRWILALGVTTLLLAIPTVFGLWIGGGDGGIPPWDQWIAFAVDRWYGDC